MNLSKEKNSKQSIREIKILGVLEQLLKKMDQDYAYDWMEQMIEMIFGVSLIQQKFVRMEEHSNP